MPSRISRSVSAARSGGEIAGSRASSVIGSGAQNSAESARRDDHPAMRGQHRDRQHVGDTDRAFDVQRLDDVDDPFRGGGCRIRSSGRGPRAGRRPPRTAGSPPPERWIPPLPPPARRAARPDRDRPARSAGPGIGTARRGGAGRRAPPRPGGGGARLHPVRVEDRDRVAGRLGRPAGPPPPPASPGTRPPGFASWSCRHRSVTREVGCPAKDGDGVGEAERFAAPARPDELGIDTGRCRRVASRVGCSAAGEAPVRRRVGGTPSLAASCRGGPGDGEAFLVDGHVMPAAQQHQVVQVGETSIATNGGRDAPPGGRCRWQPGNRQPPSRIRKARRNAGEIFRVLRPNRRCSPGVAELMRATSAASQAIRSAVRPVNTRTVLDPAHPLASSCWVEVGTTGEWHRGSSCSAGSGSPRRRAAPRRCRSSPELSTGPAANAFCATATSASASLSSLSSLCVGRHCLDRRCLARRCWGRSATRTDCRACSNAATTIAPSSAGNRAVRTSIPSSSKNHLARRRRCWSSPARSALRISPDHPFQLCCGVHQRLLEQGLLVDPVGDPGDRPHLRVRQAPRPERCVQQRQPGQRRMPPARTPGPHRASPNRPRPASAHTTSPPTAPTPCAGRTRRSTPTSRGWMTPIARPANRSRPPGAPEKHPRRGLFRRSVQQMREPQVPG